MSQPLVSKQFEQLNNSKFTFPLYLMKKYNNSNFKLIAGCWLEFPLQDFTMFTASAIYKGNVFSADYKVTKQLLLNSINEGQLRKEVVECVCECLRKKANDHDWNTIEAMAKAPLSMEKPTISMNTEVLKQFCKDPFFVEEEEEVEDDEGEDEDYDEDCEPEKLCVAEFVSQAHADLIMLALRNINVDLYVETASIGLGENKKVSYNVLCTSYGPNLTWEKIETIAHPICNVCEDDAKKMLEDMCRE